MLGPLARVRLGVVTYDYHTNRDIKHGYLFHSRENLKKKKSLARDATFLCRIRLIHASSRVCASCKILYSRSHTFSENQIKSLIK